MTSECESNGKVEMRRAFFEAEPPATPNLQQLGIGGSARLSVRAPPQHAPVQMRTTSAPSTPPTRQPQPQPESQSQPQSQPQDDRMTALCAKVDELSNEVQALRLELRTFLAAHSNGSLPTPAADAKLSPVLCARCSCEMPGESEQQQQQQPNGSLLESSRDSRYLSAIAADEDGSTERTPSPPAPAPLAAEEGLVSDTFA